LGDGDGEGDAFVDLGVVGEVGGAVLGEEGLVAVRRGGG